VSPDTAADPPRLLLVTGTLAEPQTRAVAEELARRRLARPEVAVLRIQVAALMTPEWVRKHLELPPGPFDRVILPGGCRGELQPLSEALGLPVQRGPREVRDLITQAGGPGEADPAAGGAYTIEILAEVNEAAHLSRPALLELAGRYAASGADLIDLGCDPGTTRPPWRGVGEAVRALREAGHRVSIDSFHPEEIAGACAAGAERVLSVTARTAERAADWGAEVVVLPEDPATLEGLEAAVERLERDRVPYHLDPVIEPIGFGFARSLGRYLTVRDRYPEARLMMGVGNLSEMTGVDSAGVNMLLTGFCQELEIGSVLTTEVIPWCRSSVAELEAARRIVHAALARGTPPKHLSDKLLMLRDRDPGGHAPETLEALAARLTDPNVRIFTEAGTQRIHAMRRGVHARGEDPFELFDALGIEDASHAFYLGWEMAKAHQALLLGKRYEQDEALDWGLATRPEKKRHGRRKRKRPGGKR